jgi:hypothetical protein
VPWDHATPRSKPIDTPHPDPIVVVWTMWLVLETRDIATLECDRMCELYAAALDTAPAQRPRPCGPVAWRAVTCEAMLCCCVVLCEGDEGKEQQHNTTHHNTTQHNTTQHNTTQHNTSQHNTTQHNTTQHNTTQHNTTHHNTSQHNTTQHNTTQHITSQQQLAHPYHWLVDR